jgi:predicted O-linked N-acetylglucosamine transferase (SPINDLY family)
MATSLLTAVGLPECIARDRNEYVALAIALGNDPARLASLRQQLHDNLPESALFQPQAFVRDLERLYRAMHAQKRSGKSGPITLHSLA